MNKLYPLLFAALFLPFLMLAQNMPTAVITPESCEQSNGAIDLTPDPFTPGPHTYEWSNGETTQDLNNIPSGTYTVTVYDANNQKQIEDFVVPDLAIVGLISGGATPNTLCIGGNGTIDADILPAPPIVYFYEWSNGETTEDISGLAAGTYTLTVTFNGTCTASAEFEVPENAPIPQFMMGQDTPHCEQPTGSLAAFMITGPPPHTFEWSNGATTALIQNLAPGDTYTVTVTNSNGCSNTASSTLGNTNYTQVVDAVQTVNTTCLGGNASINITVSPATPQYTYEWTTGATTQDVSGLTAGLYYVTVTHPLGGPCFTVWGYIVEDQPIVPNISTSSSAATCGNSNGSAGVSILNGGPPPPSQVMWSSGQTAQNLMNLPAGDYTVSVTGSNGCVSTASVNIPDNQVPYSYNATVTPHTACDTLNGKIAILLSPSNLTLTWWDTTHALIRNNLAPGSYAVTISAGGTCFTEDNILIPDLTEYPVAPIVPTATTCGQANGAADMSITAGQSPFTVLWSTGDTSQDLAHLVADTFFVTVTSDVGCAIQKMVIIPNKDTAIAIAGAVTENLSCSSPTGAIALDVTPVDTMLVYAWSTGDSIAGLSNLAAGTYTVTVSLGVTCVGTASYTVAENAIPPNLAASGVPAICGQPNGAIDLNVNGGLAPYTFDWSNGLHTEDLGNLPPGAYDVTVTGANDCTATSAVTVADNSIVIGISATPAGNTSCTAFNGAVDISVNPAGTYTYNWSNSQASEDISNLNDGNYTVTVTLGNCNASQTFSVADNTSTPALGSNITASICGAANGGIDLSVSGANPPYTFAWSNSETTEDLSNLLPGNYTVTVTAGNGCTSSTTLNVANNAGTFTLAGSPVALTNCAANNGAIDLNITPAGAYTIVWSNGETTEDLQNLAPGIYTVSVTESNSCTGTASYFVLDQRTYPLASQSIVPELCDLGDGSIDVSVSGGATPYGFLWDSGQNVEDLNGLTAGTYTVTVTDANGCTATTSATVPGNSITFSLAGASTANSSCLQQNGSIDLNITPAGSYTINWSNLEQTEDLSALSGGTYVVTVSAGGSCTNTASFVISDNTPTPQIATDNIANGFCGQASGGVDLSISGSPAPYVFNWSDATSNEDLANVLSGTYTVTVTASNGCTSTQTFTVPETTITPAITSNITLATSCLTSNGAIDLSVSPVMPYTYTWEDGSVTEDLTNIAAGIYTVTVDGGGACIGTAVLTVGSDAPAPQLSAIPTGALCGQSDGGIDLNVSGLSPAPYNFLWSNTAQTEDLSGVPSGSYTVTVTASNGCSSVQNVSVPDDVVAIAISSNPTAATSCLAGNGAIDLSVTPANLTYTYNWSNSAQTQDLSGLNAGTYTVTVNGGGNCINTATVQVNSNTVAVTLNAQATAVPCFGDQNGAINLSVLTGTAPYSFNWSGSIPGNPEDPANLSAGTYTVTVTDQNGCTSTTSVAITQPASAVQLQCGEQDPASEPTATDGIANVNIGGGTAPYTVTWSPGGSQSAVPAGNFPINNLGQNSYGVTVTDANGCPLSCNFNIGVAPCLTSTGSMAQAPLSVCGPGCATATYNNAGQVLPPGSVLEFVLHQGSGNQIAGEIARSNQPSFCFNAATMSYGTTYYISAIAGQTGTNGSVDPAAYCSVSSLGTPVIFREEPVAAIQPPANLNCAVDAVTLSGSSSISPATYQWSTTTGSISGSSTQANATATQAGNYRLIVTVNGCKDTTNIAVVDQTNNPQAQITPPASTVLTCLTTSIALTGTVTGTGNGQTAWFFNGTAAGAGNTLSATAPGTYQLVLTDSQTFCADTAQIQLTQSLNPPSAQIAAPAVLTCAAPAQSLSGSSNAAGAQFSWATIAGTDTTILGSGATLSINTPGTYHLLVLNPANGCVNATQVNVTADQTPPVAEAGTGFTLDCAGETLPLSGSGSGAANLGYGWSTTDGHIVSGGSTAAPLIDKAGTYLLTVTNPANGCTDTDEVLIEPEIPIAYARVSDPACAGDLGAITIDSVTGLSDPIVYTINGAQANSTGIFNNLSSGPYELLVSGGNGCSAMASLEVAQPQLLQIDLETEVEILLGHTYQVDATVNIPDTAIAEIAWTPADGLSCADCLDPLAAPQNGTHYTLVVKSTAGCEARSDLALKVDRTRRIFVPNIFTPGAADNNVLTIYADVLSVVQIKSFRIYSRWGEEVFSHTNFLPGDTNVEWNGTFKGQDLNPAVFVWTAEVEFVDGKTELFKGDITLMR